MSRAGYVPAAGLAEIYVSLREIDAAFEWADKAVDQRDPMILAIQIRPVFDRLRSDQRYSAMLRKMNLA
jgi:hypothetical protein